MDIFKIASVCSSEESALEYLINQTVFMEFKTCPKCKSRMNRKFERKVYRCSKKSCRKEISIFVGSFFSENRIGIHKILMICYLYVMKSPVTSISSMVSIHSESINHWTSHFKKHVADNVSFSEVIIGGPGIIVEVDETKLGKRKYHRGHRVEGVWVLAGIERTPEKRIFLVELPDRSKNTIKRLMEIYIAPGSIINTDCWKSYDGACDELNFQHFTVNHSIGFINTADGTHTNTVEGLNNGIKSLISPQHRKTKNINDWLWYYIWRRQNKSNLWDGFMDSLRNLYYVFTNI